jgi:acyl carrier protein
VNDAATIEKELIAFIASIAETPVDVDRDTDLLGLGVLDSLMVTDLVLFMESSYGVALRPRDISPTNFRRVSRMAELVAAKRGKRAAAA